MLRGNYLTDSWELPTSLRFVWMNCSIHARLVWKCLHNTRPDPMKVIGVIMLGIAYLRQERVSHGHANLEVPAIEATSEQQNIESHCIQLFAASSVSVQFVSAFFKGNLNEPYVFGVNAQKSKTNHSIIPSCDIWKLGVYCLYFVADCHPQHATQVTSFAALAASFRLGGKLPQTKISHVASCSSQANNPTSLNTEEAAMTLFIWPMPLLAHDVPLPHSCGRKPCVPTECPLSGVKFRSMYRGVYFTAIKHCIAGSWAMAVAALLCHYCSPAVAGPVQQVIPETSLNLRMYLISWPVHRGVVSKWAVAHSMQSRVGSWVLMGQSFWSLNLHETQLSAWETLHVYIYAVYIWLLDFLSYRFLGIRPNWWLQRVASSTAYPTLPAHLELHLPDCYWRTAMALKTIWSALPEIQSMLRSHQRFPPDVQVALHGRWRIASRTLFWVCVA